MEILYTTYNSLGFKYVFSEYFVLCMQKKVRFNFGSNNLSFRFQSRNDLLYFLPIELNKIKKTSANIALAKWRVKCKLQLLCFFIRRMCSTFSFFFNKLASVKTHRLRYC